MNKTIIELENVFKVETVLADGVQVWPFIRMMIYFFDKNARSKRRSWLSYILRISRNIFYGIWNWFGHYDVIVLGSSELRKSVNGIMYDKSFDYIIESCPARKMLYIDLPKERHVPYRKIPTVYCVSGCILEALSRLFLIFEKVDPVLENLSVVNALQQEAGTNVNILRAIKNHRVMVKVYSLLYKIYRPKLIFINCAYGNIPAVRAAKEMGIVVVEMQHGVIGRGHPAYNSMLYLDRRFYPDYLMTFGDYDKDALAASTLFEKEKIIPVGSFYLDYIEANFVRNQYLSERISKFRISVAVTLQQTVERELIEFIRESAKICQDVLFILIPRSLDAVVGSGATLANVMIVEDLNFYQIVKHCNFHTTVYSTCALESTFLGVYNIYYNFNDLSERYFGDISDEKTALFVKTPEEYKRAIDLRCKYSSDDVKKNGEYIFKNNFKVNVKEFVDKLF